MIKVIESAMAYWDEEYTTGYSGGHSEDYCYAYAIIDVNGFRQEIKSSTSVFYDGRGMPKTEEEKKKLEQEKMEELNSILNTILLANFAEVKHG